MTIRRARRSLLIGIVVGPLVAGGVLSAAPKPAEPAELRGMEQAPVEVQAEVEVRLRTRFIAGVRNKDSEALKEVMAPEARHIGYESGEFGTWTGADWFKMVDGWKQQPGPMPLRNTTFEVLSVGRDTAIVQVRLDFAFGTFTDLLSLEHIDERWMIVNKVFCGGQPRNPAITVPSAEDACEVVRRMVELELAGDVSALAEVCHPLVFARRVSDEGEGWRAADLAGWAADEARQKAGRPVEVQVFPSHPTGALVQVDSRVVFAGTVFVDRYALLATKEGWRVVSRMTETEQAG